jgi:hypothetical protein
MRPCRDRCSQCSLYINISKVTSKRSITTEQFNPFNPLTELCAAGLGTQMGQPFFRLFSQDTDEIGRPDGRVNVGSTNVGNKNS